MGIILTLVALLLSSNLYAGLWQLEEIQAYHSRNFVELAHNLTDRGLIGTSLSILAQRVSLMGCSAIHRGTGNAKSVIQCIEFLDREQELKIYSSGRARMISDLNFLCERLSTQEGFVGSMLESSTPLTAKCWRPCWESIWKQIYLTAYANFDARPIKELSFLRKAQARLPSGGIWADRAMKLIQRHP